MLRSIYRLHILNLLNLLKLDELNGIEKIYVDHKYLQLI